VQKARAYRLTGHSPSDTGETYLHHAADELLKAIEMIPVPAAPADAIAAE